MIDDLVDAGHPVKICCRLLGVSSPGYYRDKRRPLSATRIRREWLTGLIREVHAASRQTYGSRRVHAELTRAMEVQVSERLVAVLMSAAGIAGLPGPAEVKRLSGIATADDLVRRKFHRLSPNELWVTDITEHPTREGKVYCCAVMDTFSRRIVGWSIDTSQDSNLVVNALDMALKNRNPPAGGIVHADHGVQGGFNRSTRQVRLTEAGAVFLQQCRNILAALDLAVASTRRAGQRKITIAARPASGTGVLPALLSGAEQTPSDFWVDVVFTYDEVGALNDGTADVALMCQSTAVPGLEVLELGPERAVVLHPVSHPAADRSILTLSEVEALTGYEQKLPNEALDVIVDRVGLGGWWSWWERVFETGSVGRCGLSPCATTP